MMSRSGLGGIAATQQWRAADGGARSTGLTDGFGFAKALSRWVQSFPPRNAGRGVRDRVAARQFGIARNAGFSFCNHGTASISLTPDPSGLAHLSMIVCSCNVLSDQDVRSAVTAS